MMMILTLQHQKPETIVQLSFTSFVHPKYNFICRAFGSVYQQDVQNGCVLVILMATENLGRAILLYYAIYYAMLHATFEKLDRTV